MKIKYLIFILAFLPKELTPASIDGTANAEIIEDLSITEDSEVDFATIIPDSDGGTVTINASTGTLTCSGGLECSGSHSLGQFTISGTLGESISISVTINNNLTDGSNSMTFSATVNPASATFSGSSITVNVGGTLTVGGNQTAGDYNGTFTLTSNY